MSVFHISDRFLYHNILLLSEYSVLLHGASEPWATPGRYLPVPWWLLFFAALVIQFTFSWKCGVQLVRSMPVPRYPERPLVVRMPRRSRHVDPKRWRRWRGAQGSCRNFK